MDFRRFLHVHRILLISLLTTGTVLSYSIRPLVIQNRKFHVLVNCSASVLPKRIFCSETLLTRESLQNRFFPPDSTLLNTVLDLTDTIHETEYVSRGRLLILSVIIGYSNLTECPVLCRGEVVERLPTLILSHSTIFNRKESDAAATNSRDANRKNSIDANFALGEQWFKGTDISSFLSVESNDKSEVVSGFIISALIEGVAPQAIMKIIEMITMAFETFLLPLLVQALVSPEETPIAMIETHVELQQHEAVFLESEEFGPKASSKKTSKTRGKNGKSGSGKTGQSSDGLLAKMISADLLATMPSLAFTIADHFTALLAPELHSSLSDTSSSHSPMKIDERISKMIIKTLVDVLPPLVGPTVSETMERTIAPFAISNIHKQIMARLPQALTSIISEAIIGSLGRGEQTVQEVCGECFGTIWQQRSAAREESSKCLLCEHLMESVHFAQLKTNLYVDFYSEYYFT